MRLPCVARHAALPTSIVICLAGPGMAQSTPATAPETPPATAPAAAPLPDLTDIKTTLTDLRGLEFERDVPAEAQSVEAWSAYVDEQIDRFYPPDRWEGIGQGLVRLGMLTEEMDLGKELKDAYRSQAGAYYDPASGKFYYLMVGIPMILDGSSWFLTYSVTTLLLIVLPVVWATWTALAGRRIFADLEGD